MRVVKRARVWAVAALLAAPAVAASQPRFEARATRMPSAEARFLESLFELSDAVARENAAVLEWFASDGEHGLHAAEHALRLAELSLRIEALDVPPRLGGWVDLIVHAIAEQRGFFADWARAMDERRPFDSQLVSEYGYHAGLHRSQRDLVQVWERALAWYGDEDEGTRRAIRAHLGALGLLGPGGRR